MRKKEERGGKQLIEEDKVNIKWHSSNKERLVELGYKFTFMGDELRINVEELLEGSHAKLTKICDLCGSKVHNQTYKTIIKRRKLSGGEDRCKRCSDKIGSLNQIKNTKFKDSIEHYAIKKGRVDLLQEFSPENDIEPRQVKIGTSKKYKWVCSYCGNHYYMRVTHKVNGSGCNRCGRKISYPERFLTGYLNIAGIKFEREKKFKWAEGRRYDFYIESHNTIIETHGNQHYTEKGFQSFGGPSLQEIQRIDRYKEDKAKENGIVNYIVVDCRKSNPEYIWRSVNESQLSKVLEITKIPSPEECHLETLKGE